MATQKLLYAALILCTTLLMSCSRVFKYVQICTTRPIPNATMAQNTENGLRYENEDCIISYNMWANGGNAGFEFFNKTDNSIRLDLSQTVFVRNGIVYDYYSPQAKIQSESQGSGITFVYSYTGIGISSTTTKQSYTAGIDGLNPILIIPSHASRIIVCYEITDNRILDCDLKQYPADSVRVTFNSENSPLTFSNHITYAVGDSGKSKVIENQFYVSSVCNYAEPYSIDYRLRTSNTCENRMSAEELQMSKSKENVYDKYILFDADYNFYKTYSTNSKTVLYTRPKGGTNYYWSSTYHGYIIETGYITDIAPKNKKKE